MMNLGDVPAGSTLYVPFATYNAAGASVTITGFAVTDIEIYKNGSITQRASDAGYTLLDTDGIDFDGITGIHGFSVDLADNTDAGFYAAGSAYFLVVSAITVDSQTVNFVYYFTIDRDNVLRPTTAGRTLDVTTGGEAGLDLSNVGTLTGAWLGIVDSGTAQSATGTTLVLAAAAAFADDTIIGATLLAFGSTQGYWQQRQITDVVLTTDTVTVDTWTVTPSGTITYIIIGTPPGSSSTPLPVNVIQNAGSAITATAGRQEVLLTAAGLATDAATEIADAVGTRQIPDSYAADGAQPTIDQAILGTLQVLTEAVVSGATILIKKPDGTTNAMTITCAPSVAAATSRTRSA